MSVLKSIGKFILYTVGMFLISSVNIFDDGNKSLAETDWFMPTLWVAAAIYALYEAHLWTEKERVATGKFVDTGYWRAGTWIVFSFLLLVAWGIDKFN